MRKHVDKKNQTVPLPKNEHRQSLQELRNFAGAHRDKDAAKQLEVIDDVDLLGLLEVAADFYAVIECLVPFLTRTILKMGDGKVLIRGI